MLRGFVSYGIIPYLHIHTYTYSTDALYIFMYLTFLSFPFLSFFHFFSKKGGSIGAGGVLLDYSFFLTIRTRHHHHHGREKKPPGRTRLSFPLFFPAVKLPIEVVWSSILSLICYSFFTISFVCWFAGCFSHRFPSYCALGEGWKAGESDKW